MLFSALASHRDPRPLLTTLRRRNPSPNPRFPTKPGLKNRPFPTPSLAGRHGPFLGRSPANRPKVYPKPKLTQIIGSKSGDDNRVFFQKNLILRTFKSYPNPGVLRGFPESESDNRSPKRACFSGEDIPVRVQNKAGSGGIRKCPKGK